MNSAHLRQETPNSPRPPQRKDNAAAERQQADVDLLQRALAQGGSSWTAFCRRYEALIISCVRRVLRRYGATHTSQDLADLVADIWVLLLRDDRKKLRLYDPDRGYRLSSWIGLIATNATIDALRARNAAHTSFEDLAQPDALLVDLSTPESELSWRQAAALAQRALNRLEQEERDFVAACFREDRPAASLAAEFGISVNTVYTRKFKLRAKLARIATSL